MPNNAQRGRADLQAWEASKPTNFFLADTNLQAVLEYYLGERYPASRPMFVDLGAQAATVLDHAAKIEDRIGNHPKLERWSGIGERREAIEFHPNHDLIGAVIWQSGIMALQAQPGQTVPQMALFYLLNHNGEGGHMCSLACTAGLIRVLQQVASPDLQARFLPPLLDPHYSTKHHAAQFLTEVQGGSDVGANAVTATLHEDGRWRINGEKWFCSNINADQFLLTARPADAPPGTKGLGLFLVPRLLDDGSTNGFYIRRLKDKLGTRTLASTELDFIDAVAYAVGPLEQGFKNTVEWVLNTSRLMNAVACAGIMRRAALEASTYACTRQAFGQAIIEYPLVQAALADLQSETAAAVASSFALAHLLDQLETGQATPDDAPTYRMLVNINKYITSIRGSAMVHRAIEVLGGNGAIESFSILPRLYRDMVVLESWEGTHNVLCLQVLRDIQRYQVHEPFLRFIHTQLEHVHDATLRPYAALVEGAIGRTQRILVNFAQQGEPYAQAHCRQLVDTYALVAQAALLLAEAQWEIERRPVTTKPISATYFINRHLNPTYDPLDDPNYLQRLAVLAGAAV